MMDILRDVNVDGYRLTTWATSRRDWRGQTTIGYRLTPPEGVAVFEGEDFHGSPLHADDSDETLASLMGFLTLRPGDVDREYFRNYTPEQMDFARGAAEGLSMWGFSEADGRPGFVDWAEGVV